MVAVRIKSAVHAVRRDEILQAAVKEIGRQGLMSLTMDDCARAAGVAKGTLYLYFKDKDDLTASAIQSGLNRLKQELEIIAAREITVAERLRQMLVRQLEFFDANRQLYRVFLEEKGRMCGNPKDPVLKRLKKGRQGYVDFMIAVVSQGIESGEFRNLSPAKLGMIWVEMVGGMAVHRLTSTSLDSPEEDANFLLDLFLKGASSSNGRKQKS